MKQRVLVDGFRLACLAIAAHVGRDGAIAGLGERLQLMAPRIPGFRKAVAEEHDGPASRFGEMDRIPFASTVRWAISVTRLLLRFGIDLYAFDDDSNMGASAASGARSAVTAAFATVTPSIKIGFPVV